jgi:probable F420-dependent oxidoreductase
MGRTVAHPRKFRFGVEMLEPFEGMSWAESARKLEDLGYSTLFVSDHFDEGFGPVTGMAAAVAATTTLKVAPAVLDPDFRHPAVLARELATIDLISRGRVEVGLGAGYNVADYATSGIQMDPPGIRVSRLMEYVSVLRGLFREEPFTFHGTYFNISELKGVPAPYTAGGPPIFIAGGGKRMLTFAATHADIIGVNVSLPSSDARPAANRNGVPSRIDEKLSWIREAAGDRFAELELHAWVPHAHVTNDPSSIVGELTESFGVGEEDVRSSPRVLVGSVDEIVDRLCALRERWGYSYFTILQPVALDFADVVAQLAS